MAGSLLVGLRADAQHTIRLRSSGDGRGVVEIEGEVIDYTGQEILISRAGRQQAYPAERVIEVVADWPPGYTEGRQALAEGNYTQAIEHLTRAAQADMRVWVRRLAMEGMIDAYAAQEDWLRAGDLFVSLAASDPATPAIARPPLPWHPVEGVPQARAEAWLQATTEAAQLLGASHLLPTNLRGEATKVLGHLARSQDPRIALLAQAQLWRTQVVTARLTEVAQWEQTLGKAAVTAGGGPWLVVGEAYAQRGEPDRAALAYLHAPIDFPDEVPTAARGLYLAAQVSQRAGHVDQTRRLVRQLATDYPHTPPAIAARSMLQSAPNSRPTTPDDAGSDAGSR